jgi:threonylcarbamoyladenosine tRNA methylthiotransferase MtaB
VVDQIRRLTAEGYNEVVLTGVDVTSWGSDLPGQPTLGQLVARILKLVPDLPRLRLSSIDAAEIDPDLLRCMGEEPRLMPYLHLSLQAGDDMILKRMKRRHSREQALDLVASVRAVRPDVAFGADLIAGFPTETDEMFDNTVALVEQTGLAFLHVFPFSPRPGTPAARMPQLDRGLIKRRLVPVAIEGPPPPPGTLITRDGVELGEMRSARAARGIAQLRLEALAGGPLLCAEATLRPAVPDWMALPVAIDPA